MYSKHIRKQIFEEEILKLESNNYISEVEKESLLSRYSTYYSERKRVEIEGEEKARASVVQKEREMILRRKALEEEQYKKLQTKIKTPEQIRERNITWMLVLGTLLLLLGGLVLATNNWDEMTPLLKTLSIGFVSGLFYSLHLFTGKKLKIAKTAFAFLTLGSLFIPITIISAGYFELFGHWFSLAGAGKYLYLAIGLGVTLPVYFKHGMSTQSRFYVWLSYISLSLTVAFFIASFYPSKDIFYISVLLFNVVLLVVHRKLKDKKNIFAKDLPLYAQGNLALSTLLLFTVFYNEDAFFGINVILTAMIYLFVLFSSKRHENHYVFTVLFIYGAYMVIENTALQVFDLALLSSFGFLFVGLANKQIDENLKKLLNYTSAFVSLFAFIFVTGKAILFYDEYTTLLLAVSYLLLSLNYGFLAHILKKKLFNYTAVFFLTLTGVQLLWQLDKIITLHVTPIGYVLLGVILYIVLYVYNQWELTMAFKFPSLVLSLITMVVGIYNLYIYGYWTVVIASLLLFALVTFKVAAEFVKVKEYFYFISALSIYSALIVLYPLSLDHFVSYTKLIPFHGHLIFVSLIGVGVSFGLRNLNVNELTNSLNWLGLILYSFSLVLLINDILTMNLMVPLYLAIGTYLTARMGHLTKINAFYYISSVAFAVGYVTLMVFNFRFSVDSGFAFFIIGPILLLIVSRIYKQEYFVMSQLNTFGIFAITLLTFENTLLLIIISAIIIYCFTIINKPLLKVIYLYVSLTMLPIILYSTKVSFAITDSFYHVPFIFFISSIVFFILSYYLRTWAKLVLFYSLVFSGIGLSLHFVSPIEETTFTLITLFFYIILTISMTIYAKLDLLALIPLLISIGFAEKLSGFYSFSEEHELITYTVLFFAITLIGQKLYKKLFTEKFIDMFAVVGFVYLAFIYHLVAKFEMHIIVELLPSMLIVYYFYSQINRLDGLSSKVVKTITYVSVLVPYYKILSYIAVPKLLEMEAIVLPWIVLLIFFSMKTWKEKEKEMNIIQWFGLIITAGFIVQDALASNTIYDAFIIGILSLSAIFYGFSKKLKSYFIIGSVVLLLTILIQTKPFWGNMPWWIYLIVAGSLLIGVGSYHEWKKQRGDTQKEPKWKAIWKKWK
ncbi:hypothetical protein CIB95_04270 [Lottiidibacillus patelloidae]|uniref:DUF2157 domain-containing protein n=1 Tax=Lottiidibacillus patelloidae TaxID=2670334 RepID=A0A263BVL6_9BACI|nr:DUF2157 domain-containing protein [Lottiidibacillus patelloidae]OZM57592.1 hypothetical protein CIB95_04270 [Lottiidibacillus patelloidae]